MQTEKGFRTHPMSCRMSKTFRTWFFIAFGTVAADQLTKAVASHFEPYRLSVIPNFFSLTLTTNSGSIWGLGADYTQVLAWLGIVFVLLLCVFFRSFIQKHPMTSGFLTGGMVGNTIDRFARGYVTDFLDFYIQSWHWPCFNVADIAITGTCLWLMFGGGAMKEG